MTRVEGDRAIVVGGDVIRSILNTGDHARFFIGAYEALVAAYIDPGQLYADASLDQFVGREWLTAELDAFLPATTAATSSLRPGPVWARRPSRPG